MAARVEIDPNSGFCGGVIRAIHMAEEYLDSSGGSKELYSLGAIVHNEAELSRLEEKGLKPITGEAMDKLPAGANVLIRAHGEPPSIYKKAREAGIRLIDCTCPVVLRLQSSIREAYSKVHPEGGQIIIFGKVGHAEVLGLLGQVGGDALVIEDMKMLMSAMADGKINMCGPVEIFSQTTKSPAEYASICSYIEEAMAKENELPILSFRGKRLLRIHDTICKQVATRHEKLSAFALKHDVIVFVSSRDSSNGKVLYDLCKSLNIRTYLVSRPEDVRSEWFRSDDNVGVCGATSTPKWLLENVAERIGAF